MVYKFVPPEKSTPCNVDPDAFFPDDDDYTRPEVLEAIEACKQGCWFFYRCKQISKGEEHGVWAGTTPEDRGFTV